MFVMHLVVLGWTTLPAILMFSVSFLWIVSRMLNATRFASKLQFVTRKKETELGFSSVVGNPTNPWPYKSLKSR